MNRTNPPALPSVYYYSPSTRELAYDSKGAFSWLVVLVLICGGLFAAAIKTYRGGTETRRNGKKRDLAKVNRGHRNEIA